MHHDTPDPVAAIDARLIPVLRRRGPDVLRTALGVVFLWFGALKLIGGASPAKDLAVRTTARLGAGRVPAGVRLRAVGTLEVAIGLGLLTGRFLRLTLALFGFQMTAAMLPLALFPREMFRRPWQPTLEGQYVIKNLVLIAAGLVVGSRVDARRPPAPSRWTAEGH